MVAVAVASWARIEPPFPNSARAASSRCAAPVSIPPPVSL